MSSTPRLVQRLGLVLAVLGVVAGIAAHAVAAADPAADALAEQREMRDVARLGGTATVQAVKFNLWLGSLWHGERLGPTLAVLGWVLGFACWKLGGLMAEDDLAD